MWANVTHILQVENLKSNKVLAQNNIFCSLCEDPTEKEKSYSINRARDGSLIRKTMAGFLPHTVYKNQLYVDLKI